jgi:LysM repeat protein
MKHIGYKVLLEVLKVVVLCKRAVFWIAQNVTRLYWKLDAVVRDTIGYRLYLWQKRIEGYFGFFKRFRDGRIIEFVGQRGFLQMALVAFGIFVIFPQSIAYTNDTMLVPGRKTVLYALAGPGDQNFDIEEIVVDRDVQNTQKEARAWNEGAVDRGVSTSGNDGDQPAAPEDLVFLAPGGGAIIKPVLAPRTIDPTVAAPAEQAPKKSRGPITHIVESGDVLGTIAAQYGISIETILWSNNLSIRSVLRPGQKLTILSTSGLVHSVKSGDTLGRIARLYSAEVGDIMEENDISSGSTLQIGQKLVIPGGRRIAAAPVARATTPQNTAAPRPTTPAPAASNAAPSGGGYIWPTTVRTITQYYGWRHTGVDIAGPTGSPLYASRGGTVTKSQCGWNGGYGCYIILNHGNGVETLYAHASQLYISVGESVVQGQTIALMGSTGRSTGPHIHFEVRVNGGRANPFNYVN